MRVETHGSIDSIKPSEWQELRQAAGAHPSVDLRLLRTIEQSLSECDLVHLCVRDEQEALVGYAAVCSMTVDLALLASRRQRNLLTAIRRLRPRFAMVKVLLVGLPVSMAQDALLMTSACGAILPLIDDEVSKIASVRSAHLIVYKEFTGDRLADLHELCGQRGYYPIATPPTYTLQGGFTSFQDYKSRLRSHYRYDIRRSERKLGTAEAQVHRSRDHQAIADTYTPEMHGLYTAVVESAAIRLETLPREFFLRLAENFDGIISLTWLTIRGRVASFNWALEYGSEYYLLFCGIDYAVNKEFDCYFNIVYTELANAAIAESREIHLGQTADMFKARLGATGESMHALIRGSGVPMRAVLRLSRRILFPAQSGQTNSVYRRDTT
jgi:predicted N-acyltransferase